MAKITHDVDVQNWPKMPQVVNEAAAQIRAETGTESMTGETLKRKIEKIGEYRKDSVIPSDYCYNRINLAPCSFRHLVLIHVGRSSYRYVGPSYNYHGPVTWKPKQKKEREVGFWKDGDCNLEEDPRKP